MDFDNSWDAVFRPGKATRFFDIRDRPRFEVKAFDYSASNAWWLAELSRLIYREDRTELGTEARGPNRDQILEEVHLQEALFCNRDGTQCAVIESYNATGDRFRVLVFRGSSELRDWLVNLNVLAVEWPQGGLVHAGFKEALDKVWTEIDKFLSSVECPIFYTGHSLGAALATLAASKRAPHALYTFGSPRVGDEGFAKTLKGVKAYRVVNNRDIVSTLPPSVKTLAFCHIGELYYITHDSRLLVNPSDTTVALDRLQRDSTLIESTDYRGWFTGPPEFLADHAPANYVAHLERKLF